MGMDIVRVPFRGGADLANAMLSGSTPLGLFGLSNMLSQIDGGLFKLLGVNSEKRSPLYAEVPTFIELKRGLYPSTWFGAFAPKGIPRPIVQKVGDEIERIINRPEFQQRMYFARGIEPLNLKYQGMMDYLNKDIATADAIVKEANYQPQ
jgi:tripartite-type tricarboxylate transporter receptor subunit TctC